MFINAKQTFVPVEDKKTYFKLNVDRATSSFNES